MRTDAVGARVVIRAALPPTDRDRPTATDPSAGEPGAARESVKRNAKRRLARPERFELPTTRFEVVYWVRRYQQINTLQRLPPRKSSYM